jgi:hypothetical protein
MKTRFLGIVKDRMNENKVVYRSRPSSTWEEAHTKAERKARSLGCGERFAIGTIIIMEEEGGRK